MSRQLKDAREEITEWGRTLDEEESVDQKTEELNRAHEQMLRVEKMASIGKLAAIVAHEINNPPAGILTHANLLKKQFARENDKKYDEALASLDLIETDSRRCGEIIKNLLTLAMSHMFEPFFTTKERGHELGLGLAFSRMIVERHHGQIDVESEIWHGTGFTITLPLEGAAATATTAGKQVAQG